MYGILTISEAMHSLLPSKAVLSSVTQLPTELCLLREAK